MLKVTKGGAQGMEPNTALLVRWQRQDWAKAEKE
jgi:hypothetical protein